MKKEIKIESYIDRKKFTYRGKGEQMNSTELYRQKRIERKREREIKKERQRE
jgi:hypothetical protein